MSLHVYTGPMFSGKTTTLNQEISKYLLLFKRKGVLISPSIDNRSKTDNPQTSHNPCYYYPPNNLQIIQLSKLDDYDFSEYDVIGIEEAHFFPNLHDNIKNLLKLKKRIYVAGLDSNYKLERFKGEIFSDISELLYLSDTFEKMSGICIECLNEHYKNNIYHEFYDVKKGSFTKRIKKDNNDLLIGGKEMYMCVCRYHHNYSEVDK